MDDAALAPAGGGRHALERVALRRGRRLGPGAEQLRQLVLAAPRIA
jgi:hypothetical protein